MKEEKISTGDFRIEKNVISFNDTLLQISNISQVSAEPVPKKKFNYKSIIALFLGVILVYLKEELELELFFYFGIIFIITSISYFLWIFVENSNNEGKYLHLYLNAGNVYYIYCKSEKFLKQVMEVIEYCVNQHSVQEIRIDFKKCKLYNSPVVFGDENKVD